VRGVDVEVATVASVAIAAGHTARDRVVEQRRGRRRAGRLLDKRPEQAGLDKRAWTKQA
jgi:hypothetical protein